MYKSPLITSCSFSFITCIFINLADDFIKNDLYCIQSTFDQFVHFLEFNPMISAFPEEIFTVYSQDNFCWITSNLSNKTHIYNKIINTNYIALLY